MWKQEGFQGFMKGNGINVIRVSLSPGLGALELTPCRFYPTPLYSSQSAQISSYLAGGS